MALYGLIDVAFITSSEAALLEALCAQKSLIYL